jgi:hypothetical protein
VYLIALVDESGILSPATVASVAIALQIQLDRDLTAHWGVRATLVVAGADDLNPGLWPLRIVDPARLPEGAGGIHLNEFGQPYALVAAGPDWTVAASHELLEMVVDPYGNRFVGGPSASPDAAGRAVYYLVEVCDPCETMTYSINGTRVSDFVLPAFYERAAVGPLDLLGWMTRPLQILPGGYLSWYDPDDGAWHEALPDGTFSSTVAAARLDATDLRGHRDSSVEGSRHDLRALVSRTPASRVDGGQGGAETEAEPPSTFEQGDPRKDALDIIKPKERESVEAFASQQYLMTHSVGDDHATSATASRTSTPATATGAMAGGRAFIRPEERPEVGRPQADWSQVDQPGAEGPGSAERPRPENSAARSTRKPARTRRAAKAAPSTTRRKRSDDST